MLKKIEDLFRCADAENDKMGAEEYLKRSYSSGKSSPDFTELKEAQYLGSFYGTIQPGAFSKARLGSPEQAWIGRCRLFGLRQQQVLLVRHRNYGAILDAGGEVSTRLSRFLTLSGSRNSSRRDAARH